LEEVGINKEDSMTYLSDAHHFRKMVAGACMVLAPLLFLVAMVIHPETGTSESSLIAAAADSPDAWYLAHLLVLVSIVLAVPAVLGLMHMLREREVAYGHVGGGLGILGLLAFTGLVTLEGLVGWQMAVAGDRAEMVALLERIYDTAGVVIPLYFLSFAFTLGAVCLAAGLYRARAVQWWMAMFVAVGAVCAAIGGAAAIEWLAIVGAAFLFVGLGSIGRMVLTESDEDWEHTPEYRGFRALPGTR
jgi:hypothetical protein